MKASEMDIEQIERTLENLDWTAIHKLRVFSDYGTQVVIFTDGTFTTQDQGTYYPDPDEAGVLTYLDCWGVGNIDRTYYFEGWVEQDEDSGLYREIETGRMLTQDEALTLAIEEGDFDYGEDVYILMQKIEEERAQKEIIG